MKITTGDIFEITLEEGNRAYAQALEEPEFAFFEESPEDNSPTSPLFRVWVHKSAPKQWKKIGNRALSSELQVEVPRFKQDAITKAFSIYINQTERSAPFDQIKYLECAAVWENTHLIERLSDHFAGRKNMWVESLMPKPNG